MNTRLAAFLRGVGRALDLGATQHRRVRRVPLLSIEEAWAQDAAKVAADMSRSFEMVIREQKEETEARRLSSAQPSRT